MKKMIFLRGLFFMVMGLFLAKAVNAQQLSDCEIAAVKIHTSLQEAGYSHKEAYEMSGIALEWCEWAASF